MHHILTEGDSIDVRVQPHQIVAHGDETGAEIVGVHHAVSLLMIDRGVIIKVVAYN